jgi:endonuclease/exonuclease/phosphatase family metal-dependent hydrolase
MMVLIWGFMKELKKNNRSLLLLLLLLLCCRHGTWGQTNDDSEFPILFYNVENLFDCKDDSLTSDEQFLPDALRHWNFKKYNDKINRIAKVILASNGWDIPVLVGVSEVENDAVLKRLVWETGLSECGYRFLHHDSPDKRGMDVALLYRKDKFRILTDSAVNVSIQALNFFTRDILYVKGVAFNSDTLHVFVCHLPSQFGGSVASEPKRVMVARKIKGVCDSLLKLDPESKIVIMGDMNENPGDKAVNTIIGADGISGGEGFVDLAENLIAVKVKGTVKYHGRWEVFDQIIVSQSLMKGPFRVEGMSVVGLPFLLEKDEAYSGVKPFRTFIGPKYNGGFSDHLPVKAVIIKGTK